MTQGNPQAALKLLVATDGSADALRAAEHVAALAGRGLSIEAVLCNVQPPVLVGEVGVIAHVDLAERKRTLAAAAAFEAARAVLAPAGVAVTLHEASGDAAHEIVAAARDQGCDGIVIGRRGLGALASLVLGSVSSQVARLAHVPVTLA